MNIADKAEVATGAVSFLIGVAVTWCFMVMLCGASPSWVWHKQIIEHGAGRYNPGTGEFEWLKPDTAPGFVKDTIVVKPEQGGMK